MEEQSTIANLKTKQKKRLMKVMKFWHQKETKAPVDMMWHNLGKSIRMSWWELEETIWELKWILQDCKEGQQAIKAAIDRKGEGPVSLSCHSMLHDAHERVTCKTIGEAADIQKQTRNTHIIYK